MCPSAWMHSPNRMHALSTNRGCTACVCAAAAGEGRLGRGLEETMDVGAQHQMIATIFVTWLPEWYTSKPDAASTRAGWTFFERSSAELIKPAKARGRGGEGRSEALPVVHGSTRRPAMPTRVGVRPRARGLSGAAAQPQVYQQWTPRQWPACQRRRRRVGAAPRSCTSTTSQCWRGMASASGAAPVRG